MITGVVFWEEVNKLGYIAGPMVAVTLSVYLLQVVSVMMVGHLGELALSSTSIAFSLAGVTGFSVMVWYANLVLIDIFSFLCVFLLLCFGKAAIFVPYLIVFYLLILIAKSNHMREFRLLCSSFWGLFYTIVRV